MAMAAVALVAVLVAAGPAQVASQAYGQEARPETTIKVSGEASASIPADEATMTIAAQTQPGKLSEVLEQQQDKVQEITDAVKASGGNDTTVTISQQSVNPFYPSSGMVPSNNITFSIYASAAVRTNVNQLPDLVQSLADAGFGFESVYIDPSYQPLLSGVSPAASVSPAAFPGNGSMLAPPMENGNGSALAGNETGNQTSPGDLSSNPVTISVSLITEPGTLEDTIKQYDEKYQKLLDVAEQADLPQDAVQTNYFNIQPVFYGSSQSDRFSTYTQLVVRTDPDNIEAITNAVQDVSNAYVENTFMSLSDSAIDSAREDLTKQAMESARDRADEIAAEMGMNVTGIKSVDASTNISAVQYPGDIRTYRGVQIAPPYYYQYTTGQVSVSMAVEFALG